MNRKTTWAVVIIVVLLLWLLSRRLGASSVRITTTDPDFNNTVVTGLRPGDPDFVGPVLQSRVVPFSRW